MISILRPRRAAITRLTAGKKSSAMRYNGNPNWNRGSRPYKEEHNDAEIPHVVAKVMTKKEASPAFDESNKGTGNYPDHCKESQKLTLFAMVALRREIIRMR
jgi:hypothetical protein